jgi:hypothetical protein
VPFFQVLLRKQFHSTSQTFFKHFKTQKNKNEKKNKAKQSWTVEWVAFKYAVNIKISVLFCFRDDSSSYNLDLLIQR